LRLALSEDALPPRRAPALWPPPSALEGGAQPAASGVEPRRPLLQL